MFLLVLDFFSLLDTNVLMEIVAGALFLEPAVWPSSTLCCFFWLRIACFGCLLVFKSACFRSVTPSLVKVTTLNVYLVVFWYCELLIQFRRYMQKYPGGILYFVFQWACVFYWCVLWAHCWCLLNSYSGRRQKFSPIPCGYSCVYGGLFCHWLHVHICCTWTHAYCASVSCAGQPLQLTL